jgi:hypothetical protein
MTQSSRVRSGIKNDAMIEKKRTPRWSDRGVQRNEVLVTANSFYSHQTSISTASLIGFDDALAASLYKQNLVEAFCCDSVSSGTVAALFQTAPILRSA